FYQPRYMDVLPLFCGFLLISPLVVSGFLRKPYYLVLFCSVGCWIFAQYYSLSTFLVSLARYLGLPYLNQSPFNFLAWQLLFVLGVFVGLLSTKARAVRDNQAQRDMVSIFFCI